MPTSFGKFRPDVQRGCVWNRFDKADFQRGRHGLDSLAEKTVGHRRIEQRADHSTMQLVQIALAPRIRLVGCANRVAIASPELQPQRISGATRHTRGMTWWWNDRIDAWFAIVGQMIQWVFVFQGVSCAEYVDTGGARISPAGKLFSGKAPQFVDLALKIINGRFDRVEPKTGRRTRLSAIAEEAVENALPLASGGWAYPIWTLIETTTLPKTLTETCARTVAQAFSISISAHFYPAAASFCVKALHRITPHKQIDDA